MLKHRTIWAVSLISASIAMSACQPKKTEPEQPQAASEAAVPEDDSLILKGQTEKLALGLAECDGNDSCPQVSIERLSTNQPFVDALIDQEIIRQLNQVMEIAPGEVIQPEQAASESAASEAAIQTAKQRLEQQVSPFLKAVLSMDQELKQLSSSHQISIMVKPKILNSRGSLVTVVLNTSSYLGGAHGSSAQEYYNFDLKDKKLVKLKDVLVNGQQAKLEQLAHSAFKSWIVDSKLAENTEEYEQAWKFKLSENYYMGKDGLILQYAEYEIGPYVVGLPRLTIPYTELQQVLKKQYLPEDATLPASSAQPVKKAEK